MNSLFFKELWLNWKTPWGYLKAAGFLLLAGYFFVSFTTSYNDRIAQYTSSQMAVGNGSLRMRDWIIQPYFESLIFFLMFFAPLGSMGCLGDEFRNKTFIRLNISPLSSLQIVLAKFAACLVELFVWSVLVSLPPLFLCLTGGESVLPCFLE